VHCVPVGLFRKGTLTLFFIAVVCRGPEHLDRMQMHDFASFRIHLRQDVVSPLANNVAPAFKLNDPPMELV
jgi:hypothetical protein